MSVVERATGETAFAVPGGEFVDHHFRAMGTDVRIFAAPAEGAAAGAAQALTGAVARAEALVHAAAARLTRFDENSELRRLGRTPRETVEVSPLLARAIEVALRAAADSHGLIDPTLASAMEHVGYADDWDPARRLPLAQVLAAAPPRAPAAPALEASWRRVSVDLKAATVTRPFGLELDLGGTAKGLIADLAVRAIGPCGLAFVDAGGDLSIVGHDLLVLADDPFGGNPVPLQVSGPCGVATSSIAGRAWAGPAGPAHHLLDPSTERPAFTGVVQATACAPSAAEAERFAGEALLAGPLRAPGVLRHHGGMFVLEDGTIHRVATEGLR